MTILLAVLAPIIIGFADHNGVNLTRRDQRPMTLVLWIYVSSVPFTAIAALALGGSPAGADLAYGSLAGVFAATALLSLYRGYSVSGVGVVAPVAAVTGAVVPIGAATILSGFPSAVVQSGLVVGVAALWLIGFERSGTVVDRPGLVYGTLAGVLFGMMSVMLGLTAEDSGIVPLLAARIVSVPLLLVILRARKVSPKPGRNWTGSLVVIGLSAALGASAFTIAAQRNLAVAGLFMQMAYGFTLVFQVLFAGERFTHQQVVGFLLAIASLSMISLG